MSWSIRMPWSDPKAVQQMAKVEESFGKVEQLLAERNEDITQVAAQALGADMAHQREFSSVCQQVSVEIQKE